MDVQYETGVVWQDFQHKQMIDLFERVATIESIIDESSLNHQIMEIDAAPILFQRSDDQQPILYPNPEWHLTQSQKLMQNLHQLTQLLYLL